jgi:hypothetical protein
MKHCAPQEITRELMKSRNSQLLSHFDSRDTASHSKHVILFSASHEREDTI